MEYFNGGYLTLHGWVRLSIFDSQICTFTNENPMLLDTKYTNLQLKHSRLKGCNSSFERYEYQ